MNTKDPKYQEKSKSISSAEPNYFVHFAMRYPVGAKAQNVRFACFYFLVLAFGFTLIYNFALTAKY